MLFQRKNDQPYLLELFAHSNLGDRINPHLCRYGAADHKQHSDEANCMALGHWFLGSSCPCVWSLLEFEYLSRQQQAVGILYTIFPCRYTLRTCQIETEKQIR